MSKVPWSTYRHWIAAFCRFYRTAQTTYDIHSPFVFQLVQKVLEDQRHYYIFDRVRGIRHYWREVDQAVLFEEDLGAGSRAGQGRRRGTKALIKHSAIGQTEGEFLFRLALYHRPNSILELGTNLGISSCYLRAAASKARMITIEGNPALSELAQKTWRLAGLSPPEQVMGSFEECLPKALEELGQVDLLWLDGDHRGEATISYVRQCLPFCHEHTVLAVADIHWSSDMELAWEELKNLPEISLSVDLFYCGLLYFTPISATPQHFQWISRKYKPWRMGFFAPRSTS